MDKKWIVKGIEMIRVLHIGLSFNYGGIENFVMNYYREIIKENIQFDFVNPYDKPLAFEKEIIKLGGVVYDVPDFHKVPLAYRKKLSGIIKNYSIVHIHMLSAANMLPLELAKKYGVKKIIAHSHTTRPEGKLRFLLHNINYRKVGKVANNCYSCSMAAGKWMFGENVKFKIMKNAILLKKYGFSKEKRIETREKLGIEQEEIIYGNVGRLNVVKNQLFLVNIFYEILKKQKRGYLCIVGEGEMRENIVTLSKKLQIENRVLLLGNRTDVDELYNAFDCMIFPSIYEGLPISLVEAQANGLKCYVSKDNVPAEVKILDTLEFIHLEKSACEWADIIVDSDITRDANATEELRRLNYDITMEAKKLADEYQN